MFAKRDTSWWEQEDALRRALLWGALLVVMAGISYLAMVNRTATLGLQIHDLERTKGNLEDMSRRLELSSLKMQSLDYVVEQSSTLRLVKPTSVSYLDPKGASAALSALLGLERP